MGSKPLRLENEVNIQEDHTKALIIDYILPNRTWDLDKLQDILPIPMLSLIDGMDIALDDEVKDTLFSNP